MRFISVQHPPFLPQRWNKLYVGRINALNAIAVQSDRVTYIKKHPTWNVLKKWLASLSNGKCWYCEAKSSRAPWDVDHFRPKLGVTVERIKLALHTGYYWIAYEWWNFRLSCQRCNRPETYDDGIVYGKANEFPINNEATRCRAPGSFLTAEAPRLLDPCVQADCELLAHPLDGEVKAVAARGTWEFERADYTIRLLGWNAFNAPEERRTRWQDIAALIRIAGNNAPPDIQAAVQRYLSVNQEYSSFFRSAIGSHRDKPWIEALL